MILLRFKILAVNRI